MPCRRGAMGKEENGLVSVINPVRGNCSRELWRHEPRCTGEWNVAVVILPITLIFSLVGPSSSSRPPGRRRGWGDSEHNHVMDAQERDHKRLTSCARWSCDLDVLPSASV